MKLTSVTGRRTRARGPKAYTTSTTCPQTSPVATYSYDQTTSNGLTITNGIGRRTGMTDPAGSEAWSYDSMGRVLTDQRTTNGLTATFRYTYNFDGSVNMIGYGNTGGTFETVTYTQGGAGRYISAKSNYAAPYSNYVTSANYAPNGIVCSISSIVFNATRNYYFNNRFQPLHYHITSIPWGGNGAPTPCSSPTWTADWLDLTYTYVDANGHNNGNMVHINDNTDWAKSESFSYDSLNRLATAQTNGVHSGNPYQCWAETYTYDPWGNLYQFAANTTTQSAYIGCSQESGLNTTANTKNQLTSYNYDAAGNLISIPSVATYTYNAENQLTATAGVTYTYDGDGKRVMKSSGTLYWYGLNSGPLMETSLTGIAKYAYYFFNGQIVNRREFQYGGNVVDTYVLDQLGNTNIVSGYSGAWDQSTYYPFGGERPYYSNVGNHYKFTGKERDSESGLDNFEARYMSSNMGRFMSPDPLGGHQEDPQTLNKYVYVRDNPLNLTDPSGLDFYLQCQKQSDTCGKDSRGNLVQGTTTTTTDANGNTTSAFNATVVTSASLQDPNSGNTATVNENGVQITTAQGTSQGVFVDNTPAAQIQGSGQLQGFKFDINGNCSGSCLTSGQFTFNGSSSRNAVRQLLYDRGSFTIGLDFVSNLGMGDHPYSSQHRFGGPLNSPHLSVTNGEISSVYSGPGLFNLQVNPAALVPVTGGFHVDAHSDLPHHTVDVVCAKTGFC